MGVSASGKSTVAEALAMMWNLEWFDADDLHSPSNLEKMSAGLPLNDADRRPWLEAVGRSCARFGPNGGVAACSALKRTYRNQLRTFVPHVTFLHLTGPKEVLAARAAARQDHFMPAALLDSQLAALEPLGTDERGFEVDASFTVQRILASAGARLAPT